MAIIGTFLCLIGLGLTSIKVDKGLVQHLPWVVWGFICMILGVLFMTASVLGP